MDWSEPQQVPQQGTRKKVTVEVALLDAHPERFVLYQNAAGMIPTMWTLWDQATGTQHFLYAEGWENARQVAAARIETVLKEKPKRTKKARRATRRS